MSNPSEKPFDVESIQGPDQSPSETADPKTTAEEEVYKSKALTPAQVAQKSHADHLKTLQNHIDHHQESCRFCHEERRLLQVRIETEKDCAANLRINCAQLREIAWSVRWMNLLGNSMVVGGGVCFGVAGCWPAMEDHLKYGLASGGIAAGVCGLAITILAACTGWRVK
jgi:hypothetical protein